MSEITKAEFDVKSHRRADIQGLRAIAVLLVLLFHTGLIFDSGFIGVDVFFVISGYVITSMLWRQGGETGVLNVKSFYAQRFRRLVPALALTVTITMLVGALLFSPVGSQETTAQTAIGGMFLASNLVIERVSGSYFGVPAETNALLNLWSLSVEEQFYLAFPMLLLLALSLGRDSGRRRTYAVALILIVTLASFWLCLRSADGFSLFSQWQFAWLSGGTSSGGFYSPLTRSWEFGVGAIAALMTLGALRKSRQVSLGSQILSTGGGILLIVALLTIDSGTPFPSLWTLLPVLGTVFIIASGALGKSWLTRSLSIRPLTAVGDWSYSIYLWNWPAVVLAATLWPDSDLAVVGATCLGFVVAVASYRFWETPLRGSLKVGRTPASFVALAIFLVPISIGALFVLNSNKLIQESGFMKALAWVPYFDATWNRCSDSYIGPRSKIPIEDTGAVCVSTGPAGAPVDVAIHGDSHAGALFPGIANLLPNQNVALGYTPENAGGSAMGKKTKVAILAVHWEQFQPATPKVLTEKLQESVRDLLRSSEHVVVVEDVPLFSYEAADCAFPAMVGPDRCSEPVSSDRLDYAPVFLDVIQGEPNVSFVELRDLFCGASKCRFNPRGTVAFRDSNHLNPEGSDYVARRIAPHVEKLLAPG